MSLASYLCSTPPSNPNKLSHLLGFILLVHLRTRYHNIIRQVLVCFGDLFVFPITVGTIKNLVLVNLNTSEGLIRSAITGFEPISPDGLTPIFSPLNYTALHVCSFRKITKPEETRMHSSVRSIYMRFVSFSIQLPVKPPYLVK